MQGRETCGVRREGVGNVVFIPEFLINDERKVNSGDNI